MNLTQDIKFRERRHWRSLSRNSAAATRASNADWEKMYRICKPKTQNRCNWLNSNQLGEYPLGRLLGSETDKISLLCEHVIYTPTQPQEFIRNICLPSSTEILHAATSTINGCFVMLKALFLHSNVVSSFLIFSYKCKTWTDIDTNLKPLLCYEILYAKICKASSAQLDRC